jgi:hypothetical protein
MIRAGLVAVSKGRQQAGLVVITSLIFMAASMEDYTVAFHPCLCSASANLIPLTSSLFAESLMPGRGRFTRHTSLLA